MSPSATGPWMSLIIGFFAVGLTLINADSPPLLNLPLPSGEGEKQRGWGYQRFSALISALFSVLQNESSFLFVPYYFSFFQGDHSFGKRVYNFFIMGSKEYSGIELIDFY